MHRLDRSHSTHYILLQGACNGGDEYTIVEYFNAPAGRVWRSGQLLARVQHYIKWLAVQRFATPHNQRKIESTFFTDESDLRYCLECVAHALTRINCFQVRIFAALLFNMCTLEQITQAGKSDNQRLEDAEVEGAWAKPFQITLHYVDPVDLHAVKLKRKAWCWPTFAPPSAMQWLLRTVKLSTAQCAWLNHVQAGLQNEEEAHGEKLSWWLFWRGMERWCPLEQYATEKAAKEAEAELHAQRKQRILPQHVCVGAMRCMLHTHTESVNLEREDTRGAECVESPRAAQGKPVVAPESSHAWSSLTRLNTRLEFNSGFRVGIPKRWANLSVESINRNTNRCV